MHLALPSLQLHLESTQYKYTLIKEVSKRMQENKTSNTAELNTIEGACGCIHLQINGL